MVDAATSGFVETELGLLPAEWPLVSFGDLFDSKLGKMLSKAARQGNSPKPYMRNANVQWLRVNTSDVYEMDFAEHEQAKFLLVPGDILICEGGEVGRTAIWRGEIAECYYQKAIHRARPKDGRIDSEFFMYHMLHSFTGEKRYTGFGTETTIAHLPAIKLKMLPIPCPAIEEQRAIASVLRTLQRAKEATEKVIAAARQLKQSLMRHLFTYGPVPFQQAEQVELQESESGIIPADWGTGSLSDILREPLRNGHSAKATNTDEGIRTLILTAVTQNDFCIENTKLTTADPERVRDMWLQSGDIFIERANTPELVGLAALYEGPSDFAIFPDLLIRVRVDDSQMQARFLAYFLLTPTCRRYFTSNAKKTAGNFPKIDQGIVEKTPLPRPSLQVQGEIASALKRIDVKLKAERQRLLALEETFDSLLHELMTGQRRVHNLDKLEVL